jgi:hypothetical protein
MEIITSYYARKLEAITTPHTFTAHGFCRVCTVLVVYNTLVVGLVRGNQSIKQRKRFLRRFVNLDCPSQLGCGQS